MPSIYGDIYTYISIETGWEIHHFNKDSCYLQGGREVSGIRKDLCTCSILFLINKKIQIFKKLTFKQSN